MASFIIVVDVGNTSVSLALARRGDCSSLPRRLHIPARGLNRKSVSEALVRLSRGRRIQDSILCSVVPASNPLWVGELHAAIGRAPMLIHHGLELGVDIAIPEPREIGADRLANACAASHFYGTPAIVLDFGTALTFDVVSRNNEYVGGVIAPGLALMTDYFAERTALLPRLEWTCRNSRIRPSRPYPLKRAIGKNTEEAMLIGAEAGYLGMVREILKRLQAELKSRRVRVCATGGHAEWVLTGSGVRADIDPDLTLRGISRIYELNS